MNNDQYIHLSKFNDENLKYVLSLLESPLAFTRALYPEWTQRDFDIPQPLGRESHIKTIFRDLVRAYNGDISRLIINVAPGSGKSTLLKFFIAWWLANWPDSNFIYVSYSKDLAATHTQGIREIISLPIYRKLFGIEISGTSRAADHFKTTGGGTVYAAGSDGSITGFDAGLPIKHRPSGALIIDDAHKPSEIFSEVSREAVKRNFKMTLMQRCRSDRVPIINLGQRLHEDDLHGALLGGFDGFTWTHVNLPSLDHKNNSLHPIVWPADKLRVMQQHSKYEFASQHQQNPIPAGGGLFSEQDFPLLDDLPAMLATFITCDTAETSDEYNDPSVFSFWGLYKPTIGNVETDTIALCWLDCHEAWIEPRNLESEFYNFYAKCNKFAIKPLYVAVEKKNTGVTLISVLKTIQGLKVLEIERTIKSGSKGDRFLSMQKYIGARLVALPRFGKHTAQVITHMTKITANCAHKHDDICDTCYDAVKIALIDRVITGIVVNQHSANINPVITALNTRLQQIEATRGARWQK